MGGRRWATSIDGTKAIRTPYYSLARSRSSLLNYVPCYTKSYDTKSSSYCQGRTLRCCAPTRGTCLCLNVFVFKRKGYPFGAPAIMLLLLILLFNTSAFENPYWYFSKSMLKYKCSEAHADKGKRRALTYTLVISLLRKNRKQRSI